MGDLVAIIQAVKENKEKFYLLLEKMEPLVNKYTYLLYKDTREDVQSELILALWEAVGNMQYHENDGQIVTFLSTAVRNRYFELYKKSRKLHDFEVLETEDGVFQTTAYPGHEYEDIIFREDIMHIIEEYSGVKRDIINRIIFNDSSDSEIANQLQISRQYVNRIRRILYEKIRAEYSKK